MIRPALLEDAPAIAAIHVRTWQVAYAGIVPAHYLAGINLRQRTEFWQQELAAKRSLVLTSIENDEVVGWASGGESRDADAQGESEIYAIYVSPDSWGRGIGRTLIAEIENRISPCSGFTLWVLGQNQRAINFYRKIGYAFDGTEKRIEIGNRSLSEARLRKKVPN